MGSTNLYLRSLAEKSETGNPTNLRLRSDAGKIISGQNINVGQATETDLAQAIGKTKYKAVGQVTETETVNSVTKRKSKAVAYVSENDSAETISNVTLLNQSVETDSSQAVGKSKRKVIGQAGLVEGYEQLFDVEGEPVLDVDNEPIYVLTDDAPNEVALVIGAAKRVTLGYAQETDSALIISTQLNLTRAEESDSALSFGKNKFKFVRQATPNIVPKASSYFDDDSGISAWEVTSTTRVWNSNGWIDLSNTGLDYLTIFSTTFIPYAKTYTQYLLRFKVKSDSYSGQIQIWIGNNSYVVPGNVSAGWQEFELKFIYTTGDNVLQIGSNSKVDAGVVLSYDDIILSPIEVAQAIGKTKRVILSQAIEIEASQSIGKQKRIVAAKAIETDTVNSVNSIKRKAVVYTSEVDNADSINLSGKISQIFEVNEAGIIRPTRFINVSQVNETDSAQLIARNKKISLVQLTEIDLAGGITVKKYKELQNVTETEFAQLVSILKKNNIGFASEVDLAGALYNGGTKLIDLSTAYGIDKAITIRNYDINKLDGICIKGYASDYDLVARIVQHDIKAETV